MAQDSFVRFVRNHAASTGHDFYEALLDSLDRAGESLQAVCESDGVNLQAQIRSYAGSTSLLELQGKSKEASLTLTDLIHGKTSLTDEAAVAHIQQVIDYALQLGEVAEANPQANGIQTLDERSHHLLDCALGMQGTSEAYAAGRREGLRQRQTRPRAR